MNVDMKPHTVADMGQPDGAELKRAMEHAGIQHFELAQDLGITPKHLTKFFEGKRWLDQYSILKLFKMVGSDGSLHRLDKGEENPELGDAS